MVNRLPPTAKTGSPFKRTGGANTSGQEQVSGDVNDLLFSQPQLSSRGNTPMPGLMEKYFRLKPETAIEVSKEVSKKATHGYTSSSSYKPYIPVTKNTPAAAKNAAPENNGVHPLALAGGIALAGAGASALETHVDKSKKPTALENAGQKIVGVADGVAGFVGNTLGYLQAPMMFMIGGTMLLPLVQGAAGLADKATGSKKMGAVANKAATGFATAQEMTFSQLGKKIDPTLGARMTKNIEGATRFAAPVLDTVAKAPGLSGVHSKHIPAATKTIANTAVMHGVMRGSWLTGATLGVYAAARNAGSEIYKIRKFIADEKNIDVADVSTVQALTSNDISATARAARNKMLPVLGVHALASVAGLAMAVKSNVVDKMLGKVLGGMGQGIAGMLLMQQAYTAPDTIANFVESVVGKPITELYTQMSEAEKNGQQLTAKDIALLLVEASPTLQKKNSVVAKQYAEKIAEKYVGMKVADIMHRVNEGDVEAGIRELQANAGKPKEKVWAAQINNERANKTATPNLAV